MQPATRPRRPPGRRPSSTEEVAAPRLTIRSQQASSELEMPDGHRAQRSLQVLAGLGLSPSFQGSTATHFLELLGGSDLLAPQRCLDAVEETLEPSNELRLHQTKFRL